MSARWWSRWWRQLLCRVGLHSGTCYGGAYRCAWCEYTQEYNQ